MPLLIRRAAQPAHQVAQDGEFFVEFFGGVPVVAVHADFAVAVETEMGDAAYALFFIAEAAEAEDEFPAQKSLPKFDGFDGKGNPIVVGRESSGVGLGFYQNKLSPSVPLFSPKLEG